MAGLARIVAAGEGVPDRDGLVGRLAVLPALRTCGGCLPCRRGHAGLCQRPSPTPTSARAELVAARHAVVLAPEGATPERGALAPPGDAHLLAALADVGLLAYAAMIRASVEPNRAAIVLGDGPLALFVAALVEHRGAAAIRVRRPGDETGIADALATRGIERFGIPLIDAAGGPLAHTLSLASPGSLVVLARGGEVSSVDGRALTDRGLTVVGVAGAHPDLLTELVAFVCAKTLDLRPLVRVATPGEDVAGDERAPVCLAV